MAFIRDGGQKEYIGVSYRVQRAVLGSGLCLFKHAQVPQKHFADRGICRHCKGQHAGAHCSHGERCMFNTIELIV